MNDFQNTSPYHVHDTGPGPLSTAIPRAPLAVNAPGTRHPSVAVEGPHTRPTIVQRALYWWRLRQILKMGPNL